MRKLLTILFVLTASVSFAQVTANTPAVEPSYLENLLEIVLTGLGSLLGIFLTRLLPLINAHVKSMMHFRGSSVIADALTQAIAEEGAEIRKALADGVLTDVEKKQIIDKAKTIATAKLRSLSGFYKHDLTKWVDEVMEVEFSKFVARIFT